MKKKNKEVKIAILNSYTIENLKEPLNQSLLSEGFEANIKIGGYDQINQELINESSWLYKFKPDFIYIGISTNSFLKDIEFSINKGIYEDVKNKYLNKIKSLIESIKSYNLPSKFILNTFDFPKYSPFGIRDYEMKEGLYSLIEEYNNLLRSFSRETTRINLINLNSIYSEVGTKNFTDDKLYYLGKILLTKNAALTLANKIKTIINASYGRVKKCLIVDLDNTLWGGVIGEDGIDNIKIDNSTIGTIYKDIQKIILNYKKEGVLLAIISKNNEEDVLPVFKEKKEMVLKKSDFITMRINWNKKSENIIDIAKELNLGLDSFVFLDDNPAERLEVKSRISDITIIDFPNDISKLPRVLKELDYFSKIELTKEDKIRHQMYMEEKRRNKLKNTISLNEYLKELNMEINIQKNDLNHIERIAQLTNKTNQFNLRTKRYTLEEIKERINSKEYEIYSIQVSDKFGDMGLVGVIMLNYYNQEVFIDNFLMSCRVLSRGIEKQFFYEVIKQIKEKRNIIKAEFIRTKKNSLVESFYERLGFELEEDQYNLKRYKQDLNKFNIIKSEFIKVN